MLSLRPFDTLGHAHHGWLDARHHFSFAHYRDPRRMGHGALRVWNDDTIAPQSGFPLHPHQDMEIITYVRSGAITHQDSLGNKGRTAAGDVQVMSAGSGVAHSEYNLEDESTTLFQIWILPDQSGGTPMWGQRPFPKTDRHNKWVVLASGFDDDAALSIRASARVLGATLEAGDSLTHTTSPGRVAYLVPAIGALDVSSSTHTVQVRERDGLAIGSNEHITIKALTRAEMVLVDVLE